MSVLTVVNGGLEIALNRLVGLSADTFFATVSLGLYVNPHTPVQTDTLGAYTEAAWAGYARQTVSGWAAAILSGSIWVSVSNPVLFPNASGVPQNAYGLLCFSGSSGAFLAASLFDSAPAIVSVIGMIVDVSLEDDDL